MATLTRSEKIKFLAEALHLTVCWTEYAIDEDDFEDAEVLLNNLEAMGITIAEND